MKRSGPIKRSTALERKSAMARHPTSLRRSSSKRRAAEITDAARQEIAQRDRGCVGARLVPDVTCWGPMDPHHILRRSQGGSNDPENLVTLCRAHHDWVHGNPSASNDLGLLRRSWSI